VHKLISQWYAHVARTRALTDAEVGELQHQFEDILKGPLDQAPGPVPQEANECPALPRLIIPFARSSYSRLRRLIDHVNSFGGPAPAPPGRDERI
jgi:hypothetical protein